MTNDQAPMTDQTAMTNAPWRRVAGPPFFVVIAVCLLLVAF
jgi:hypothetical protein